jgi:CDP-4-dehydro-6-deoxyglucose reductase
VIRLWLKLPDNQRLQFMAGQYLNIILPDGRHRAFSIANAPHDDALIELHIRHVAGGEFTDYVFNEMKERAILRIQAPLGNFTLRENSDRPMIFVAGGTGFAPVKGLIEHALFLRLERPVQIYWGVRALRDLYIDELPRRWVAERPQIGYVPVLSEPDASWQGRTGWVHEAVLADYPDLSGFDIYMAGPPPMVKAGRDCFIAAGASPEHIFYDAFEYGAKSDA